MVKRGIIASSQSINQSINGLAALRPSPILVRPMLILLPPRYHTPNFT
jgi:hypothetical protein